MVVRRTSTTEATATAISIGRSGAGNRFGPVSTPASRQLSSAPGREWRTSMIDFFWTTRNGQKVLVCLEETGLPYRLNTVNISKGEQFQPELLEISPNNKVPAIRDNDSADGSSLTVFEAGAILFYLAEKSGTPLPRDACERVAAMEWVFWQVGGLGPMAGQNHHFAHYGPGKISYAIQRYITETGRLYGVLGKRPAARVHPGRLFYRRYCGIPLGLRPWRPGKGSRRFSQREALVPGSLRAPCGVPCQRAGRRRQHRAERERPIACHPVWPGSRTRKLRRYRRDIRNQF